MLKDQLEENSFIKWFSTFYHCAPLGVFLRFTVGAYYFFLNLLHSVVLMISEKLK